MINTNCSDKGKKPQSGKYEFPSSGLVTMRRKYEFYLPIASYINWHPSKSTRYVAEKFGVSASTLSQYMRKYYPYVWERHLRACLKKRQRMREKV